MKSPINGMRLTQWAQVNRDELLRRFYEQGGVYADDVDWITFVLKQYNREKDLEAPL